MQTPGSLPLYQQIGERIARDIAAGRLADGDRLPPERAMAEGLGVAVGTLRRALGELAERGQIARVQGSGNYVRARPDLGTVYAFFRLERADGGGLPTAEVLGVERRAKPAHLPPFGAGPEAHRIRRLRRLDGVASAVEEIWLDAGHAPALTAADLSESLYLHYRARLGLVIARVEDRVGTGTVPFWAPAAFALRPGDPAGHIVRVSQTDDGARPEVSETWFDPATTRYVARLP